MCVRKTEPRTGSWNNQFADPLLIVKTMAHQQTDLANKWFADLVVIILSTAIVIALQPAPQTNKQFRDPVVILPITLTAYVIPRTNKRCDEMIQGRHL